MNDQCRRVCFSPLALFPILVAVMAIFAACGGRPPAESPAPGGIVGVITVFHAGSLSVPFKKIKSAFEAAHPGVEVRLEAAGSRECVRKLTELNHPCDLLASADYLVIDELLIPTFASWNAKFATNEMIIAYRPDSRGADRVTAGNWPEMLTSGAVQYGHADPNADPCGYRTLMAWQLAEKHYSLPGLADRLNAHCPTRNIRPKEVDLLALLEAGEIDYLWIYRSVAEQHHLKYVILPDEVNLKSPALAALYATATVEVSGKQPGQKEKVVGTPMVYGLTIPNNPPNPAGAGALAAFICGPAGKQIIEASGQPAISPVLIRGFASAPAALQAISVPEVADAR